MVSNNFGRIFGPMKDKPANQIIRLIIAKTKRKRQLAERLYLMVEVQGDTVNFWCAECSGGCYNFMGGITYRDGPTAVLRLKTRSGILNHRHEYDDSDIYVADPDFIQKLDGIITAHAVVVLKACKDAHEAAWRRWAQELSRK